jgi:hypothetical protein
MLSKLVRRSFWNSIERVGAVGSLEPSLPDDLAVGIDDANA